MADPISKQSVILKCSGLQTQPNDLGSVDDGSLTDADNIYIDYDDMAEPRRGFKIYGNAMGSSGNRAKQLLAYQDRLIRHYSDVLQYDSSGTGGTFTSYSGSYTEPQTGVKIKSAQLNGNFYFTTSGGVKKLDKVDTAVQNSGGLKALDLEAEVDTGSSSGPLASGNQLAYKVTWGFKDRNTNVIVGTPSERAIVALGINDLLYANFNDLLTKIDAAAAVNTGNLQDTDYAADIGPFLADDSAAVINEGLKALCDKLEQDMVTSGSTYGRDLQITTISAATPTQITTGNPHGLNNGDLVRISGSNSNANADGVYVITYVDATNFTIPVAVTVPGTAGRVETGLSGVYATPTESTQGAYAAQRDFFDAIVTLLLNETLSNITAIAQAAADFQVAETSREVTLTFTVPTGVTTDHFYQVWRSALSGGVDIDPGNELQLVLEEFYVSGTVITVNDITPDDFRGAALYTNPNQETIAQANEPPPFAKDIAVYRNSLFYANTKTVQGLTFNLISADSLNSSSTLTITSGVTTVTLTFNATENAAAGVVGLPDVDDTPAQQVDYTARSLVKTINRFTTNTLVYAEYLSGPGDVPGLIRLYARNLSTAAFSLTANNSTTGEEFSPKIPTSGISVISDNEIQPNRIYYSKLQQPEAVPLLNYIDIGSKDSAILRIMPLRDSLFIFKEDGIYRIIGENVASLSASLFDSSVILTAPESVAVGNNQIYCLTDQGVVRVSDTGVTVISRKIENLLVNLADPSFTNFASATFGLYYTTARKYYLWTVEEQGDTYATQAFVLNTFTNAWTRLPIEKTCGIVHPKDDKLYLGAADINDLEQERKTFSYKDYCDRQYTTTIASYTGDTLILASSANMTVGDVIEQEELLTPFKFNSLLLKLDSDPGINNVTYYATYAVTAKPDLRAALNNLATALDADNLQFNNYYSAMSLTNTPAGIQSDFNIVIAKLNLDNIVVFTDYQTSSNNGTFYTTILEIDDDTNEAVVENEFDWDLSTITYYNHIDSVITWNPQHAGDPSILKQFYESNLMFRSISSNVIDLSFRSDLSYGFSKVPFSSTSSGGWGAISWGIDSWGGYDEPRAFRTYVPRDKQKCRFLNPKFEHGRAFESYKMVGISLTFDKIIQRVNR